MNNSNIYNTDFKVKYYQIKQDLLNKIYNGESEYTTEDVDDVCSKLFVDELTNVFYADSIFDEKIDIGSRYIFEQLNLNDKFVSLLNEVCHKNIENYDNDLQEEKIGYHIILMCCLFSKEMFYITHEIVCQQLTNGKIDEELFDLIKTNYNTYLEKVFE
jgi:hypothetical protein